MSDASFIESLIHQILALAKEIATIFQKVRTIPSSNRFGVIWGGGDDELSDTWTERMQIWIDESKQRGLSTGVMHSEIATIAENCYIAFNQYFEQAAVRIE